VDRIAGIGPFSEAEVGKRRVGADDVERSDSPKVPKRELEERRTVSCACGLGREACARNLRTTLSGVGGG
jgi:hypothetical protein